MITPLERYCSGRRLSNEQAAAELQARGFRVSAGYIGQLRGGRAPSRKLGLGIVEWAGGALSLVDVFTPSFGPAESKPAA